MKELKGLNVAGSATSKETTKDFFLQWHLTERCNLACRHCYQSGVKQGEMGFGAIRRVAGEVSDMLQDWAERYELRFSPSFNVTGGEPFLRDDLVKIIELLAARGFEVYLLTNGTLIDREQAGRLKGLVQGVQVSMEGPEKVHDSIRGRGSFQKAVSGVENLVEQNIPVSPNCTISRLNGGHCSALGPIAKGLGVGKIGFSRLVLRGKGTGLASLMLGPDEVEMLYRDLFALQDDALDVVSGDPLTAFLAGGSEADEGDIAVGGCAAGISGLTLLPDGTVTPCRRLPIPIGNVYTDSLRQLWTESKILNLLRDRSAYTGKCAACPRWAVCRGCRAIAYACGESRNEKAFLDSDPQCFVNA